MTIEQQIQKLNDEVRCCLRPSPIHGIGVFALRDIKRGENLFVYRNFRELPMMYEIPLERFNELRPEIASLILDRWGQPVGGAVFQSPNEDANMMSFMNHSYKPNSTFGTAIRDIVIGEEVTEDYRNLGGELSDLSKKHYSFL